jgi:hypothetical protein
MTPPLLPAPAKQRSLIADVERELRDHGIPYVAVDEAKKALVQHAKLKSFHFVVYDKTADNWLLWCGAPTGAVRQDMDQWASVFGQGYQVVYAVRRAKGIVYQTGGGKRLALNGGCAVAPSTVQRCPTPSRRIPRSSQPLFD